VKALAGCPGDNVIGVHGVGEKTAVKFLGGHLKEDTKAWRAILGATELWRRNLDLVRLPFPGVGKFDLVDEGIKPSDWEPVLVDRLGMKSMRRRDRRGFGI
jgi:5'-3' exonuclease